ncbi:ty3-gypsy retrotransposon protein [Tanacetum coccineum]
MASDGSDQEAEYALSKLLQIGTVEDYQREFEMLIKLVTIPESLLKSFYISGLKLDLQCLLLRSNPSTLGEDFFKARITEARFEIIAKEEKEHIVEKKIDVILPLQSEFASPKAKGSLNADEYISVVEVVMVRFDSLFQGIIQFSQSPFSSPVLLVKKKDGSYHFCVDYRALNEVTVKDKFPIPTADEMFDELGGAVIFTKLDLWAGYHQIRVHDCDAHQFYVKLSKCAFGASTLEYLGHIISGVGVEVDPKKIAAAEAAAFESLKLQLTTTPVLTLPNFDQTFIVEMDAADAGIGAVLLQNDRPICYFSLRLGPKIQVAATYWKELFAIVEAVFKWRQYLLGRRFVIRTDHRSIKELFIEYKPGAQNTVADAFSRVFEDSESLTASFMHLSQPLTAFLSDLKAENSTLADSVTIHRQLDMGTAAPLATPTTVWKDLSMDFITGMPVSKGLTVVLVVEERFSKYAHFAPLPTSFNAHKVAEVFVDTVIKLHGIPKTIVSDRDPIFVSNFWTKLFKLSGTQLNHSTAYHPQSDG